MKSDRNINEYLAFRAMFHFLQAYWERGGRGSDDIADLLSNIEIIWGDGSPGDPAQWPDWIDAVNKALDEARRLSDESRQ